MATRLPFPLEPSDATFGDRHRKWLIKDDFRAEESTWILCSDFYCEVLEAARLQDVAALACGCTACTPLERHWLLHQKARS